MGECSERNRINGVTSANSSFPSATVRDVPASTFLCYFLLIGIAPSLLERSPLFQMLATLISLPLAFLISMLCVPSALIGTSLLAVFHAPRLSHLPILLRVPASPG